MKTQNTQIYDQINVPIAPDFAPLVFKSLKTMLEIANEELKIEHEYGTEEFCDNARTEILILSGILNRFLRFWRKEKNKSFVLSINVYGAEFFFSALERYSHLLINNEAFEEWAQSLHKFVENYYTEDFVSKHGSNIQYFLTLSHEEQKDIYLSIEQHLFGEVGIEAPIRRIESEFVIRRDWTGEYSDPIYDGENEVGHIEYTIIETLEPSNPKSGFDVNLLALAESSSPDLIDCIVPFLDISVGNKNFGCLKYDLRGEILLIDNLYIEPEHRRKGIGREALQEVIFKTGFYCLILVPLGEAGKQPRATLDFLKACGFVRADDNDVDVYFKIYD